MDGQGTLGYFALRHSASLAQHFLFRLSFLKAEEMRWNCGCPVIVYDSNREAPHSHFRTSR
jgi:hypothetical protein